MRRSGGALMLMMVRAGAVVAAAGLVAGCSGGTGGQGGSGVAGGGTRRTGEGPARPGGGLTFPLDAYFPAQQGIDQYMLGLYELADRCIAAQGIQMPPLNRSFQYPAYGNGQPPGSGEGYDFGLTSMAVARRQGYYWPTVHPSPSRMYVTKPRLSGAEKVVAEDCLSKAYRELGVSGGGSWYHAQMLQFDDYGASTAAPEVRAVFARWSACMAADGYHYQTPIRAQLGFPGGSPESGLGQWQKLERPSQAEIQTAVADVRCKARTRLVAVWSSVLRQIQAASVRKYLVSLRAGMAAFGRALRREVALLAAG